MNYLTKKNADEIAPVTKYLIPASALDPIATQKIEETITELKKEYTIIIVTHNMQQAVRVSDYTGFMYLGDLVEFRETKKLFTDPKNELTAKYVQGQFG